MIEIKDNNEVLVLSTPIGVGSKRKFELMKDDYITLKFSLLNPISFKMGCYAECDFGRFEIIEDQKPSFNNSTGGYDYELKMEASYMKWKNKVFKYTPETGGNEAAWDLTAQLSYHLDIFLRNLKVWGFQYGGEDYEYEIDNDVNVDALVMHYSNTNLIDALTSLAESANCEWWMEGKKIRFGRCEKGEAVEISLGEEAETMSLSKSSGDYFTRIYAFGSTQNISSRYRKKLEFTIDTLNRSGNKSDFKDSKKPVNPSFFRKDLIKYYSYEKQMDGVGSVSASLATPDVEEYELYDSIIINAMQLYKSAYVLDLSSMVFSYDFSSFPNAVLDVRVEIVASGNDSSTVLSESSYTIDSSNKTLRLSKERFESPYETIRKLYLRITYSCVSPLVTYIPYTIVGDCILGSVYGYVETDVNYVSDDGGNHKIGVTINRNAMPYTDEHATLLYETTSNDKLYIGAKFTIEGLVKGNVPLGYFDSDVDGLTVNGVVQRRLMLPEGTPYIDVYPDMSPDEVIEGIVTFDYIYPRKVLSISSVEEEMIDVTEGEEKKPTGMKVPVYTIKTTGLVGFDKSYVISEELTVTFQTGKLAGLTFGLTFLPDKSDGTSTCFEIVANEDYGGRLPDTVMKPEANNEFVMAGYDTEYVFENLVPEAEEELKTETEKYAEKIRNNIGTVSAKLMSDWSKARNETQDTPCPFCVGQKVRVNNSSFFPSPRTMRVLGYELALDIPWDSPVYTIGESASYSRLGALEDKIDSIKLNGSSYFSGKVSSSTSGTNVYLIKKDDETDPSDTNAYSSLRTDKEIKEGIEKNNNELGKKFLSKLKDDTASGIITFLRGLIIGKFSSGESGGQISDNGAAELASLLLRGALEIGKYSAGKSGAKIGEDGAAELLSVLVRGLVTAKGIQSPGFSTGALGTGLCLKMDENGDSYIEVDRMLVRKVAEFIQLVIQEIKHVGGQIVLTTASMKCIRVEDTGDSYRCYFEATDGEKTVENQFVAGDQARAQTFNVKEGVNENVKNTYYWRLVTGVGDNYIDLSKTDCDAGSTVPAAGDEIVQLGNRNDVARQSAIILSAYGNDAPYFKMYRGINSYKLEGKEFVNLSREDVMIISDNIKLSTGETVKEYINGAVGDVQSKVDEVSGKVEDAVERLAEQQNYIAALQKTAGDLQSQIDGAIESYFEKTDPTTSNYPANEWTTEEQKQAHSKDTYTNISTGKSWRWVKDGSAWKWIVITDTATEKALAAAAKAQDTADGKRRVFVSQPATGQAYDVGDLWVNATYGETYKNDLLRCKTAKKENEAFSISHWELASRYTDDTKANEAAEAASQAIEDAAAAKNAAKNAQADVDAEKERMDEWAADGKFSPSEKKQLKEELARIDGDKAQVTDGYTKYGLGTPTAYNTAYTNYRTAINGVVSSSSETVAIPSDFATKRTAYYTQKSAALTAISDAAKAYADKVVAGIEVGGRNLLENSLDGTGWNKESISNGVFYRKAETQEGFIRSLSNLDIKGGVYYTLSFDYYTKNNGRGVDLFLISLNGTKVMASKHMIGSPTSWTHYVWTFKTTTSHGDRSDCYVRFDNNGTGSGISELWVRYPKLEKGNVATAWTPSIEDVNGMIEDAQKAADDAAEAAKNAQADATNANNELTNIKSDNLISPIEKTALKQQQADIRSEYGEITANAARYAVSTTAYKSAYDLANAALTKYTASSPEYITVGSDYANISAYYDARKTILDAIAAAAKKAADDATNKANQAVEDAARAGHYYLDLDNDSGQVACDADGNVTGGYPTTNAKVWYGTEVDTGWSFKGTFSGCTGSVGASSGAVTVTAVSKDDASVTITATKSGKPELSTVFTIVKVKSGRDGEDGATGPKGDAAVFYIIETDVRIVKKSWDNKLTPTSVTCTKYKQTGSNARAITMEKTLKYQRVGTDSSVQTAASGSSVTVSPTSTTTSIKFWLYDGSTIIDRDEIPVVGDAVDVYEKVHAEIETKEDSILSTVKKTYSTIDALTGVEKTLGTQISELEQTASGLTSTINGLGGKVTKLEQTDSSLTSRITSAEGRVSTIEQKVDGISLKVDGIEPVNLFRDGSFESGHNTFRTSGSGKDDVEVGISANGKVGKNAMMVKWPGTRTLVYIEQDIRVVENSKYTLALWVYANKEISSGHDLVITAYNKNGSSLSISDSTVNLNVPKTSWTRFVHTFTVPTGTEYVNFYIRGTLSVDADTLVYYDGVMLLKGDLTGSLPSGFVEGKHDGELATGIDVINKKITVTSDQFVIQNNDGEVTASVNEDGVLSVGSGEFSGFIRTIPRIITKNTGDNGDVEFKDNYYQISLSNLYKGGFIYVDVESNSYAGDGIKLPLGLKYAGARVTIVNKYPAKRLIITTRHEALDPGYGDWSDDENNAMRLGGVQISHVEMGNVSTQGNNRFVELLAVPYYLDETIGSVKYQGQVEWLVLNNQEFTTANNTTGGKYAKFK